MRGPLYQDAADTFSRILQARGFTVMETDCDILTNRVHARVHADADVFFEILRTWDEEVEVVKNDWLREKRDAAYAARKTPRLGAGSVGYSRRRR